MKTVLQKFIADSGRCSRRQAEDIIRQGRVAVNKKPAELGMKAGQDDEVLIDGKKIALQTKKNYIKLNKPTGYTCTNRKFTGELNVFDLVKTEERLFVVGRLDKDSRGLVLLTNDGELTEKLTHPRYGHTKNYGVKISNFQFPISKQFINDLILKFKKGIDIGEGDGIVKVKSARYLGDSRFEIILTEGKKRQIRRMFKALGYEVNDLVRVEIAGLKLDGLKEGKWTYLNEKEIKLLK